MNAGLSTYKRFYLSTVEFKTWGYHVYTGRNMELTVEVTSRCLNRCVHCSSDACEDGVDIDTERVFDAIRDLRPDRIVLSGGEPLLHPDIEQIIDGIDRRGIPMSINTTFITGHYIVPKNIFLIKNFYISYFCFDNYKITKREQDFEIPLFAISILRMRGIKHVWLNVVLFKREYVYEIAWIAYQMNLPVHVIRLVSHGRATSLQVPPTSVQAAWANELMAQFTLERGVPEFLKRDGWTDATIPAISDDAKKRLAFIRENSKISHSLHGDICRSWNKRTLLPDGRIIGCVAGKGMNERPGTYKACESG